jgi:DNA-binding NarL/FixJ family response regulator
MLKLLLVESHELIRAGLKQVLHAGLGDLVVGEAANADEALTLLGQQPWDLAITDLTMPGRSGLELLQEFKDVRPEMPVLMLSSLSEDDAAVRVLRSGAAGYITKETTGGELLRAVRKVVDGGKYVSPELAEKLALRLTMPDPDEPHRRLSDREYVVLKMLASGTTLTQIGKILSLSIKTISTYRSRILDKLKLETNADLTRYALRHKLVE